MRQRRRLTQHELARISGVAQNTISKLETNIKARPVFETVATLAHALGINPLRLMFGPDPAARKRADREKVVSSEAAL